MTNSALGNVIATLKTEKARLQSELKSIDAALAELNGNGTPKAPKASTPKKRRTRRTKSEIAKIRAAVAAELKADPEITGVDIHKEVVAKGLVSESQSDYQLIQRHAGELRAEVAKQNDANTEKAAAELAKPMPTADLPRGEHAEEPHADPLA